MASTNLIPQSPRIERSPRPKTKWLSHTMAYQYGSSEPKNEIIVLSNDLDQYLQDIFHSIDTKGRGKITNLEFRMLCEILNILPPELTIRRTNKRAGFVEADDNRTEINFQQFHSHLCEHFACYGDYTGFLVNQTFRSFNSNSNGQTNGNEAGQKKPDSAKRSSFHKRISNSRSHKCVHDVDMFRNWDKLRLSGFRLSEMREQIDHLLYEVTFHKEESQTLKEIIEDLRTMLQASDAQNIGLQVALRRYQRNLVTSDTDHMTNYRHSMSDYSNITYKPLKGEEKSVRVLALEMSHLRDLRDKEVTELIQFNNQLQHDVTELSREMCRLEAEKNVLSGKLDLIVQTYKCCRELFAVCVDSFKEVEKASRDGEMSPLPLASPGLLPKKTFTEVLSDVDIERTLETSDTESSSDVQLREADDPPEVVLIKRLECEIRDQLEVYNTQQQEIFRLNQEVSICRQHLQSANFQVGALEAECGRLLSLEDQLVSVFRLLQKGRSLCLSRKTLGQLLLDVIDSSFGDDEQDMTAEQFIRLLQKALSECPLFFSVP